MADKKENIDISEKESQVDSESEERKIDVEPSKNIHSDEYNKLRRASYLLYLFLFVMFSFMSIMYVEMTKVNKDLVQLINNNTVSSMSDSRDVRMAYKSSILKVKRDGQKSCSVKIKKANKIISEQNGDITRISNQLLNERNEMDKMKSSIVKVLESVK